MQTVAMPAIPGGTKIGTNASMAIRPEQFPQNASFPAYPGPGAYPYPPFYGPMPPQPHGFMPPGFQAPPLQPALIPAAPQGGGGAEAVETVKPAPEKPLSDEEKVGKMVASWLKQYPQWRTFVPTQMLDQFDNGTVNPDSVNQILSKFLAHSIKQNIGGGYFSRMGLKAVEKMAVSSVPPPFNAILGKAFDMVGSKAI